MNEEDAPQAFVETDRFLGWHPFRVFSDIFAGGPLVLGLVCLSFVAALAVLWRVVRRSSRSDSFFGVTLFLALFPFIAFAFISFLRLYIVVMAFEWNRTLGHFDISRIAQSAGHAFQFGVLLSGCLLLIHTAGHVAFRNARNV